MGPSNTTGPQPEIEQQKVNGLEQKPSRFQEVWDKFDGVAGTGDPLVLKFTANHLSRSPSLQFNAAEIKEKSSVNPLEIDIPTGKEFEGRIFSFDQERNVMFFRMDMDKYEGAEVKAMSRIHGQLSESFIPIRLPGMDFFSKTPNFVAGVQAMFQYFEEKGTPLLNIPLKIVSLGRMKDGYHKVIVDFADGRNHPKRLDELFAEMWGNLCKVEVSPNGLYSGKVSHVEETGEIFFKPSGSIYSTMWDWVGKMSKQDILQNVEIYSEAVPGLEFYNGEGLERMYVVSSSLDDKLGRCKILEYSKHDKEKVLIQFIDYGNKEWVYKKELFEAQDVNEALPYISPLVVQIYASGITSFNKERFDEVQSILGEEQELQFEICLSPVKREKPDGSSSSHLQARVHKPNDFMLNFLLDFFGLTYPGSPDFDVHFTSRKA